MDNDRENININKVIIIKYKVTNDGASVQQVDRVNKVILKSKVKLVPVSRQSLNAGLVTTKQTLIEN